MIEGGALASGVEILVSGIEQSTDNGDRLLGKPGSMVSTHRAGVCLGNITSLEVFGMKGKIAVSRLCGSVANPLATFLC